MSQGADVRRRWFFPDDQLTLQGTNISSKIGIFEDDFPFRQVGYVNFLEGNLGGGFKYSLFSPLFGENSHFDSRIFFRWVETTNQKPMADNFGPIRKSTTKDAHQINKQLIL